jgi:hypothetical protein
VLGAALAIATVLATAAPIAAPKSVSLRYDVYVGDTTHPAVAGLVWLFRYSWDDGFDRKRIGMIREGTAAIDFDSDVLPQLTDPVALSSDGFVVAFELSGAQWYLSRPINPMHFFTDLPAAIETIGNTSSGGQGAPSAIGLVPSANRTIRFVNEDGTPAKSMRVGLAIHVSNANHCGVEEGPAFGEYQTDDAGVISFESPPVPLMLGVRYYSDDRGVYFAEAGLLVGTERDIVLRRTWTLPSHGYMLTVEDMNGHPVANRWIEEQIRTYRCGAWWGGAGKTDSRGVARLKLQHLSVASLWVDLPDNKRRTLSPLEQHDLFSRGSLTIQI